MKKNEDEIPVVFLQVKEDAGWRCERCGEQFPKDINLKLVDIRGRRVLVRYSVAFRDQNPYNQRRSNLWAICSRCKFEIENERLEKKPDGEQGKLL